MTSQGYLLIDGMNIGHAMNAGEKLSIGSQPTQAIYGVIRVLRPMIETFSMLTPVVLWDGRSWRRDFYPEYKAARDKAPTTKNEIAAAELKAQFKVQRPHIARGLKLLGISQVVAINYEADDLASLMVPRYVAQGKRVVLITGDKDWVQLLGKGVAWIDPVRDYRLTAKSLPKRLGWCNAKKKIVCSNTERDDADFIGVPSPRAWLEMKALMGDTSDGIPGVGGIGPKGAIDLIKEHGSFDAFQNKYVDGTLSTADLPKKFRDLIDDNAKLDLFRRNMRLMDLTGEVKLPKPSNMTVNKSELQPAAFEAFCREFGFKSILSGFDRFVAPFQRLTEARKEAA